MPPTGEGRRGVLFVAEAPGREEDERGVQLVGKAGRRLRETLAGLGWDLDRDCWKTNACCCHPPGNERPSDEQVAACRPNVTRAIADLGPSVVVLLGGTAIRSVLGPLWRGENAGPVELWAGWRVPCRRPRAWLCPTWHPSYLERENDPALDLWFERHLRDALELAGEPPWPDGPPDEAAEVERAFEPARAAAVLRRMRERGGRVAVDFETDRLKPDHPDARIVSCAACWEGRKTVAFPWHGEAREAAGELLADPAVRKVGWNAKFEQRWALREFGRGVEGWEWDGMLAAHVLDNRPGVTGLKFQALVRLGLPPYDNTVGPLLEAGGGNERNRVREADLGELLLYNGIDALATFRVAGMQMRELEHAGR